MSATKFFIDNLNLLPKRADGTPLDPEKHNLYWGLLQLARQLDDIQSTQRQHESVIKRIEQKVR